MFVPIDELTSKYKLTSSYNIIEIHNFFLTKEEYGKYKEKNRQVYDYYFFTNFLAICF